MAHAERSGGVYSVPAGRFDGGDYTLDGRGVAGPEAGGQEESRARGGHAAGVCKSPAGWLYLVARAAGIGGVPVADFPERLRVVGLLPLSTAVPLPVETP